jgi:hypothetical protein
VRIVSRSTVVCERKNWWSRRKIFSQGQKDLIRRITRLSSLVIPFRNKLVSSSLLVVSQSSN